MVENVPNDIALSIAKRMTAMRLKKTWTREELAQQSQVNIHTLKRFERTGQISLSRLIALCQSLNILDDLIRAFKPRERVNIEDWQFPNEQVRQRGRRRERQS